MILTLHTRRSLLRRGVSAAIVGSPLGALAAAKWGDITIAHIVDTSSAQQDVSKDILIGARAAWQEVNAHKGVNGTTVKHDVHEVDGSASSVQAALQAILADRACVAIAGTSGERAAMEVVKQLRTLKAPIAHVAPWLQNSSIDVDERTFPIFAGRQEQLDHALRALTEQGVQEIGAVYATQADFDLYREDVTRIARNLKLRLRAFPPEADITHFARKLTPDTPVILIFVGGTPEMMAFMQGLETQQRQRYIVALADVNLQTLLQLGNARKTSVVGTQVVPGLSSGIEVVRQFKIVLGKLFDEPPTPLSLAGFIAARYTHDVLAQASAPISRATVLAAFEKRSTVDVGGFRVAYNAKHRSASFVAQSMLTVDGRLVS